MSNPNIIIYGTDWCGDCYKARRILDRNNIPYQWINIDHDPEGEKYVLEKNNGMRSVPTILFEDGSILVEPNYSELKGKLGL